MDRNNDFRDVSFPELGARMAYILERAPTDRLEFCQLARDAYPNMSTGIILAIRECMIHAQRNYKRINASSLSL